MLVRPALLFSLRRVIGATLMASSTPVGRLQQALDAVDPSAPPRVHLTYPSAAAGQRSIEPRTLVVLDSSFNPPTRAHAHLLTTAMSRFGADGGLLLLAKQNADKAIVGASLVQRMQMMELLAAADDPGDASILCGVTAHPLFVDKASALRSLCAPGARVYMLVGFDTWIRITDPRYYPEGQMHEEVTRLLAAVDVVVASRDPTAASNMASLTVGEQEAAVLALPAAVAQGRLHFVSTDEAMAQQSSSAVRTALASGGAASRDALPECLRGFVESERLYLG